MDREIVSGSVSPQEPVVCVVKGQVCNASGVPLAGVTVRAFHLHLSSENMLGESVTGSTGQYSISHETVQASLVVKVFDGKGKECAASPVRFDALALEIVDFIVDGDRAGQSEFERLAQAVTVLLGHVTLAQLQGNDITRLAGKTGFDEQQIRQLVQAANAHPIVSRNRNNIAFGKRCGKGYKSILAGIEQKTLVHGTNTLMAEFILKKGSVLPLHAHPHEQTGYLVSGHIVFTVGDEKHDALPGDSWCIPGNVQHSAEMLQDSVAIEVFSPVREEYVPK